MYSYVFLLLSLACVAVIADKKDAQVNKEFHALMDALKKVPSKVPDQMKAKVMKREMLMINKALGIDVEDAKAVNCDVNYGGCDHICENSKCKCRYMYELAADGKTCEDVYGGMKDHPAMLSDTDDNECAINNGGCDHQCVNTAGSYKCTCYSGYSLETDGQTCKVTNKDHPEMTSDAAAQTSCRNKPCMPNSRCVDIIGGFRCDCNLGFTKVDGKCEIKTNKDHLAMTSDAAAQTSCRNKPCMSNSRCVDIIGGFRCDCNLGFTKVDGKCEIKTNNDHPAMASDAAANVPEKEEDTKKEVKVSAAVKRKIVKDFIKDILSDALEMKDQKRTRRDVGPAVNCAVNNGGCDQRCVNNKCACRYMYELAADGKTCEDVYGGMKDHPTMLSDTGNNECKVRNGGCSHLCAYYDGKYSCKCPAGYYLWADRLTCIPESETDKDHPAMASDAAARTSCRNKPCMSNSRCVDIIGGFRCDCNLGFTKVDGKCEIVGQSS